MSVQSQSVCPVWLPDLDLVLRHSSMVHCAFPRSVLPHQGVVRSGKVVWALSSLSGAGSIGWLCQVAAALLVTVDPSPFLSCDLQCCSRAAPGWWLAPGWEVAEAAESLRGCGGPSTVLRLAQQGWALSSLPACDAHSVRARPSLKTAFSFTLSSNHCSCVLCNKKYWEKLSHSPPQWCYQKNFLMTNLVRTINLWNILCLQEWKISEVKLF